MAAIVRIKRRADEEPLSGIVINCKRPKTSSESDNKENTLLQFVTTLEEPTEDVLYHIKRNTKEGLERDYKKHFHNIADKIKGQRESAIKNSRFKLINTFRSKGQLSNDLEEKAEINYTVLEVDTIEAKANAAIGDSASVKYVYDLYYTNSDDFADDTIDYQDIDIHPLNFDLVNESYRGNEGNDINDDTDDSEDSNAENNWRNDYPDEMDGDADSITEQDMLNAMQRVKVEDELSSDDGEEGFVYSIDSEAAGFEEDIDDSDVQRYGERYARFKARLKPKTDGSDEDCDNVVHEHYDDDEDSDEHYY